MQLRRALAAVSATAAIAPAALLAAPAAYAAETPGRSPAATATPAPTGTPTTGTNPPTHTPAPAESSPPPAGGDGKDAAPGPAAERTPPAAKTPPAKKNETSTPTATPTATPTDGTECADYSSERAVRTELRGLPSKIVAGSGWVDFTFRATNISSGHIRSVSAFALVYALKEPTTDDVSDHLAFQWLDTKTGTWKRVPAAEENDGFFATLGGRDGLRPGEYAEARLRLKADAKTPASYGGAVSVGWYANADHECGFSEAMDYDFTILPAGSGKPGTHVPDAQGKPGKPGHRPNRPAPQGGTKQQVQLPVTGKLAETGASSGLPTLALAGGAAVVLGAGAVFAVRRRKGAGTA
ncbi:LPXTG cell wall anchor domain-containing protein [Streptomyces albofaciens JCM 4342]|uniref:LPXTG cell wall anchor domain-containing protein n=1 Tax=Streptomyces albofaciens TaxID=66866 RepID=UPI001238CB5C|nr:LPXTG cell wall anchor domain-containing protein [Streptomyces albofaciens]KAA6214490.1 LPXTG cell wall anchor domain-containing protein [Streptomyces albofaciens JCM 4342]